MNRLIPFLFLLPSLLAAQSKQPKAVIGIVVDQMRQEYLYRFAPKFSEGGFKRMMDHGFMLRNAHYNYVPTFTGPGHASIYTGATPSVHGVIGNEWYDRTEKKSVNCVEDKRQTPVGSPTGKGAISPQRMLSTTVTDELKLATQGRSKVIGMAIKDRGAVLSAGHLPDGAFWYDGSSGNFISSTYYKPGLPIWVEQFNGQKLADKYLSKPWNTLLPIASYTESNPDDMLFETRLKGKDKPTFPYNLPELRKLNGELDMVSFVPYGDDLLTEFAKAAIDGEAIGKDEVTDFLAISYSTPDLIGHSFGPNSIELEDTYIRLDRNIQDLLATLDKKIGIGNYVVFLSADHGVGDIPQEMMSKNIPAGYFSAAELETGLKEHLKTFYPTQELIENMSNNQVFLDPAAFSTDPKEAGLQYMIVTEIIAQYLRKAEGIAEVFTRSQLVNNGPGGSTHPVSMGF
ncbi:MAG: alkaline phosphatase family protein, partial [Bacteroidota bacterium]